MPGKLHMVTRQCNDVNANRLKIKRSGKECGKATIRDDGVTPQQESDNESDLFHLAFDSDVSGHALGVGFGSNRRRHRVPDALALTVNVAKAKGALVKTRLN